MYSVCFVVKIFALPRSKSGIFDLTLNKLNRFETGSSHFKRKIKMADTKGFVVSTNEAGWAQVKPLYQRNKEK